ncbi:hypothetical protein QYG89_13985 [Bacillus sp. B190/17]|uniref:Competence protein n=1 Tax=Bacillus lumedeiriae TaxID=3058829 RepID=A0ABW8IBB4_9BACI
MGKRSKSKRFTQQGKDSVAKHAERFPYRSTFSEAEDQLTSEAADRFTIENTAENPDPTVGGY